MLWYKRIKDSKEGLETHIEQINEMITKFNLDANQFKNKFPNKEVTKPLEYLGNFQQYEMVKAKRGMAEQSHIPKLHELHNENERLHEENKKLAENKPQEAKNVFQDEALKEQLGDRYHELGELVNKAKEDLLRVAQLAKQAIPMQLKIQHPYQYSKWDSIHEPYNVVENILKDDESVYKALTPDLDVTVAQGNLAYVSEVTIYPGDCGPQNVELYWSNTADKWTLIKNYTLSKSGA